MLNKETTEINGKEVKLLETHKTNVNYTTEKQQVFIIGSKGIPSNYGGFESFVEKLTEYRTNDKIRYHVARISHDNLRYEYNGAKCFNVNVPNIGPAKAIYYDMAALHYCIQYCKERPAIKVPIFYVLACRIGPFIKYFKREIRKLGGVLYVNPDGHEWKRRKWSAPVRMYWKVSERLMVKHADLLICDSKNIEKYIKEDYKKYHPTTKYIAYGSDTKPSILASSDKTYIQWMKDRSLELKDYYLMVGRFVPENNYETIIREFMNSDTEKFLVIITTINNKFFEELKIRTYFDKDPRIKFVGTVYDQNLLRKIRENAYGYIHGHEVGGTNPSLLEALSSTSLNLLLSVEFNREVGKDAAIYWDKEEGNLADLINKCDELPSSEIAQLATKAKNRIVEAYSWESIVNSYETTFLTQPSVVVEAFPQLERANKKIHATIMYRE
ncbi:beta 1-4 rhamnosyltransferase Cps2T [Kineothrix sp. MB12-C1]|uniref:beta 1-4 rhamnosyltransferase Cps2T n=1 Tax=Kineothrix sp. MB12-C1 TaxID=3070215 RepID=UPI0027D268F5|nr:DUF1972 domain-containing protein [Kineothrix sp. MB12-C1]WMC92246.1 DUF1972 domain-containing protein [Kineothrix sp. MB12-C1]